MGFSCWIAVLFFFFFFPFFNALSPIFAIMEKLSEETDR